MDGRYWNQQAIKWLIMSSWLAHLWRLVDTRVSRVSWQAGDSGEPIADLLIYKDFIYLGPIVMA